MIFSWIKRAAELESAETPFALSTVINASAPTSAKPVAKAIITEDGKMEGWIGGGCSQDVVIGEALKCIQSGKATILRITPQPDAAVNHSVKEVLLTCESGGTLELHIEPVIPMTKLLIYGTTPAAVAVANMAAVMDFHVFLFGEGDVKLSENVEKQDKFASPAGRSVALVATQGEGDLSALKAALATEAGYIGFIASRKKGAEITAELSSEERERTKFPAGLDIGALTPEEIAISILAEIVQTARAETTADVPKVSEAPSLIRDPVCGMEVDSAIASHSVEHEGIMIYFCCGGCESQFTASPEKFAATAF